MRFEVAGAVISLSSADERLRAWLFSPGLPWGESRAQTRVKTRGSAGTPRGEPGLGVCQLGAGTQLRALAISLSFLKEEQ